MGKKMRLLIVFAFLVMVGGLAVWKFSSRIPPNPSSIAELEIAIENFVSKGQVPGLSVAVVKDGQLVYSEAFGWADAPAELPATPETIYHWWSMTKIPTALAILQLYDSEQLDLDDPVGRYLPFFEVELNHVPNTSITIRQLLRHTSGLPDTMPSMIG